MDAIVLHNPQPHPDDYPRRLMRRIPFQKERGQLLQTRLTKTGWKEYKRTYWVNLSLI